MAFTINRFELAGNLTKDIVLRETSQGIKYCFISLAINGRGKDGKENTTFIEVTVWRQAAEFASKYAHKGDCVSVEGSIGTKTTEVDGKKHTEISLGASRFQIAHSKIGKGGEAIETKTIEAKPSDPFALDITNDDLPF